MKGQPAHLRGILRRTIYHLKFQFGFPVDLYKVDQGAYNTETGIKEYSFSKIKISRAIIFPSKVQRNFFFSITFIQASSRFISGGDIQLDDRQIIIDGRDLPRNYIINIDDYFIWNHKRYDIKDAESLENGTGWVIVGRKVQANVNQEIHDRILRDHLTPRSVFSLGGS